MLESSNAEVVQAGLELRDAYAAGKVEFYVMSAKWAGQSGRGVGKGLAWGVQKTARVTQMRIY